MAHTTGLALRASSVILHIVSSLETIMPRLKTADSNRFVTTDGLHLRSSPNGAILRDLTIGESVVDLGPDVEEGWRKIRIGNESGTVFGKYLRPPLHANVEAILHAALKEWLRFEKGQANEKSDPYYRYVGEMWKAIGEPYDGRSKYPSGKDVPWSAAFISWVVREAGPAYANFSFAASHSKFVNNAIKARLTDQQNAPFWGYRITEEKPQIGDIVQRNRGGGNYSFSYAENHAQYDSHSDIVVEVTPDVVRVIGGNVDDSVSISGDIQEYDLDAKGFIKADQQVIAVLKNRTDITG